MKQWSLRMDCKKKLEESPSSVLFEKNQKSPKKKKNQMMNRAFKDKRELKGGSSSWSSSGCILSFSAVNAQKTSKEHGPSFSNCHVIIQSLTHKKKQEGKVSYENSLRIEEKKMQMKCKLVQRLCCANFRTLKCLLWLCWSSQACK